VDRHSRALRQSLLDSEVAFTPLCWHFRQRWVCAGRGHVFAAVTGSVGAAGEAGEGGLAELGELRDASLPPMTCPGRRRRSRGRSAATGAEGRASSGGRRGRTWPGAGTLARGKTCSRRGPACAGGTWRTRTTSASPRRTSSSTRPRSPRRSPSRTVTRFSAGAGRSMPAP
jgi:hypothetical protein